MEARKGRHLSIVSHYESCLEKFGNTHQGVDWPNSADAWKRYEVMLGMIERHNQKASLLDFGCGASHLYEYVLHHQLDYIVYSGLDLSPKFIDLSKKKFPSNSYYCLDILDGPNSVPEFEYVVANGVFTEKCDLSFEEMFQYFKDVLRKLFERTKVGLAFNVMSKHVDWERDDLFHVSFDTMADFVSKELSPYFVFRRDYGLYEYTTFVYQDGMKKRESSWLK